MSIDLPINREIALRATRSSLTRQDFNRYSRQIVLDQLGSEGQKRLKVARILVVGAGGLGSPCLLYLAGAGVGTIGIAEYDQVEVSNLQRQILFADQQAGQAKALWAQKRLLDINPTLAVITHSERVDSQNIDTILEGYDLVIDGSDNFATRYLVSDRSIDLKKPYVYGSVQGFSGQVGVFYPPFGPCYRCLFPHPPPPALIPNCSESGVLGSLAGTIGTLQATEAIKLVLGIGKPLLGRLVAYDGLRGEFTNFHLDPDPLCLGCGSGDRSQRPMPMPVSCGLPSLSQVDLVKEVTSVELMKGAQDVVMIDVRTAEERLAQGVIDPRPGVPLGDLEKYLEFSLDQGTSIDEISKSLVKKILDLVAAATPEQPVVLYCKTGPRSRRARDILCQLMPHKRGEALWILKGGYLGWLEAQSIAGV